MTIATVLDSFPRPPCADLLGWQVLDADPVKGWIKVGFESRPSFLNPAGHVQGGLITAMLDDSVGPAFVIHSEGRLFGATIALQVTFLRPGLSGAFVGEGQVIQMGKSIGVGEARLTDAQGTLIAKATSQVRLMHLAPPA